MKNILNHESLISCTASLMLALSLVTIPAMAHEYVAGNIEVVHPYAPPTPPGVPMAAGYLVIVNHGNQDDRLIGGKVSFAHEVQLHQTVIENDVSRMRPLKNGLVIPAGTTVKIEPMGIHLMFAGLTEPLVDGDRQSATLVFEKSGEVKVEFAIEQSGTGAMDGMHGGNMEMEGMEMEGMKMEGMEMEGMKMEGMKMEGTKMKGMKMEGMKMEGMNH